ncbi:TPA: hypothetical protein N2889_000595 [Vibrio parahaemolyticus]|uniref:hypothetical protein n=1 Tax=Vibrio parahaemolyticus TaxID=670 RepID=UPI0004F2C071|nr:hypothetical protein [Vibrio parahaemolyticus]MBM5261601.1 hypothetical protein [Vibrio parahaemolyticus]MBM5269275.1 hypothetical protein [Vibrio parahaemolyticus]MBM5292538.1 hypothetical protein [Vibrio parahaemolyticus]MBM5346416.1 hypothetical protein [Vibrio parahaemolyticus]MBM5354589.1 hypothetical protein [Vibrio parahaemolyticus]
MPDDLNYVMLCVSLAVLFMGFMWGVFLVNKRNPSNFVVTVPGLLTSGGVFFTFFGIALGLYDFDPDNLNSSISTLLSGLTLAFWSSIVGMGFSMLFKMCYLPKYYSKQSQLTAEDMQNVLCSQLSESKAHHQSSQHLLSELVSEIQLLRAYSSQEHAQSQESFNKLTSEINQFASSVSSQASQQIAESLQSSIEGFNQGLMGQFGANFQRLDESVLKMLQWQQQYKLQVEQLTSAFEHAVESVVATEQSLSLISNHTQTIPDAMDQLSETTDTWNQQITELDLRLEAFSTIRDKAVQAMPELQKQLDELCQRVDKSILNTCESLEKGVLKASTELQDKALALSEKLVEATDGIGGDLSNASGQIESMTNHLAASSDKIKGTLHDSISQLEDRLNSLVNGTKEDVLDISKTLSNVNESLIEKHREQLDKSEQLLTKAHDSIDKRIEETMNQQMMGSLQVQNTIKSHLVESSAVFHQNIQLELESILTDLGKGLLDITAEYSKAAKRLNKELHRFELGEVLEEAS